MLQRHVDRVMEVLHDSPLKTESAKKVKKDKIRAIADEMFDFAELSKKTLANNQSKSDSDQQKEFINLYKSLLTDTYISMRDAFVHKQQKKVEDLKQ
jgi:phospholipid transport system substrate-binding protein